MQSFKQVVAMELGTALAVPADTIEITDVYNVGRRRLQGPGGGGDGGSSQLVVDFTVAGQRPPNFSEGDSHPNARTSTHKSYTY